MTTYPGVLGNGRVADSATPRATHEQPVPARIHWVRVKLEVSL